MAKRHWWYICTQFPGDDRLRVYAHGAGKMTQEVAHALATKDYKNYPALYVVFSAVKGRPAGVYSRWKRPEGELLADIGPTGRV